MKRLFSDWFGFCYSQYVINETRVIFLTFKSYVFFSWYLQLYSMLNLALYGKVAGFTFGVLSNEHISKQSSQNFQNPSSSKNELFLVCEEWQSWLPEFQQVNILLSQRLVLVALKMFNESWISKKEVILSFLIVLHFYLDVCFMTR